MTGVVLLVVLAVVLWPPRSAATAPVRSWRSSTGAAGGAGRRLTRIRHARDAVGRTAALADVAEAISMALRAGTTPDRAVRVAGRDADEPWRDVLDEVAGALAEGGDAAAVWRRAAGVHEEAGFLAGAWSLSERLGSPLAPTTTVAAEVLRARLAVRRRLDAASAGPRATMVMLTALPGVGLLAGLAFGLPPWAVVTHSTVTLASVGVGLLLTLAGWGLCRVVLGRALREQVHR